MNCDQEDIPDVAFVSSKPVKAARKEYRCHGCKRVIAIGKPYTRLASKVDGEFRSGQECARCAANASAAFGGRDSRHPEFVIYLDPVAGLTPEQVDDFYYVRGDGGHPHDTWEDVVRDVTGHFADPPIGRVHVKAIYDIWDDAANVYAGREPTVLDWRRGDPVPDADQLHFNPPRLPDTISAEEAA